jgi:hypothetical protein
MPVTFTKQFYCLIRFPIFFFVLFLAGNISAQNTADSGGILKDTLPVVESQKINKDSVVVLLGKDAISEMPWQFLIPVIDSATSFADQLLKDHPYFNFKSKPVIVHPEFKVFKGKETLFYVLIVFLLTFSLLRQTFPKYFNDLFRLLFRTTLKQKQLREQLMQTPLPSFLLNVFFVFSAGLYSDLLLNYFGLAPIHNFWLLFLYCSGALSVIYTVKFVGLNITGWLFNIKAAADVYAFIVFMINKVIGIFLLPFLVLLSFIQGDAYNIAMALSWFGIAIFFVYRYFLTYTSVRNQVRFNPFHFFLYLCAFEIAPLLLIYKALLFFFHQN